jgi:hypothetical protein
MKPTRDLFGVYVILLIASIFVKVFHSVWRIPYYYGRVCNLVHLNKVIPFLHIQRIPHQITL